MPVPVAYTMPVLFGGTTGQREGKYLNQVCVVFHGCDTFYHIARLASEGNAAAITGKNRVTAETVGFSIALTGTDQSDQSRVHVDDRYV